ncbi:MAG TPA: hypothetical protein VMR89_11370 [Actinomycetota bacterium]|nr:hypothetical protein [Actinomycetota bacterium]
MVTTRRTRLLGVLLVVLTTACSTSGVGHGISVSPLPPGGSPTPTASPVSPTPTASPGPASPLDTGTATLSLSGDLRMDVPFASIATPAVWAPPPAPMDITWNGPSTQELRLSGTSFVSRAATGPDRALSFTVTGPDGPVVFSSTAGECAVTITPALPDNMGGLFTCSLLTDVEGVITVDARGVFSAIG